jgi:ubiquinone/menaquinone biosynthesis C-methylase UbiE
VLGIPDLRDPERVPSKTDDPIVSRMLEVYPHASFAELLNIRVRYAPTYNELIGHETAYMLTGRARGKRMVTMFLERLSERAGMAGKEIALDIGCGMGAGLSMLAETFEQVVGMDPSLPDLILARKALETQGFRNFRLIQAYGQRMPFPDMSFDHISSVNVLEHIFDLDPVLSEVFRVLRPGGGFAADSRNRFDLFLPEPHVKLRWVGWLPRGWAKRYVGWRRDVGYDATYLFSYGELWCGLRRHFGRQCDVLFPLVEAYGGPAWADRWLDYLEHIPVLRHVALCFFPAHLALGWRE